MTSMWNDNGVVLFLSTLVTSVAAKLTEVVF